MATLHILLFLFRSPATPSHRHCCLLYHIFWSEVVRAVAAAFIFNAFYVPFSELEEKNTAKEARTRHSEGVCFLFAFSVFIE